MNIKLIKAETTGPEKDKITPKITVTAKILWIIYKENVYEESTLEAYIYYNTNI